MARRGVLNEAGGWFETNQRLIVTVAPFAFLLFLIILFTSTNPRFLSWVNLFNLMRQSSVLLLVSIAGTYIILMGSIDLSVGEIVSVVAIATAYFAREYNLGGWVIPFGVAIGAVCGLANGVIFVYGKIPSFLTTLGMMTVLWGIADFIFKDGTIFFRNESLTWIASGNLIWKIPNSGIFALAIFGFAVFVSLRTPFGRYLYTIGSGEKVSKFSGILINRCKLLAFLASGFFSGMAGVLLIARTRNGTARMGEGLLLDSIAAIVMGGTPLTGGSGGVHRTILGVLLIAILSNGMNVAGVQLYLQIVIKGTVMMLAVAMTLDRSRIEFVK
jgi:ribose/xylose/arabinose/galactoside ABC-type transport system permease subunit